MSGFSEYLDFMLNQKNISKYLLAKKIGVDNSSFYKMLAGKRKISYNIFQQILKYVPFTYEEKVTLDQQYRILTIGEEKYYRRQEIFKFIRVLNDEEEELEFCPEILKVEVSEGIIKGKNNLSKAISSLILSEAKQGGKLRLICQTTYSFLYDTLRLVNSQKDFEIEHVICLESNSKNREADNIHAFTVTAPLFRNSFSYKLYYFYGNIDSYAGSISLFPFLILGQNKGIIFSSDLECGIVFTAEKTLDDLQKRFELVRNKAKEFLVPFTDFQVTNQEIKKQKSLSDKEICVLSPNIFFSNNCDTKFWMNLLKEDVSNYQELRMLLEKECSYAKKKAMLSPVRSYFTRKGVLDFWETGYVIDVLADYYKPVPEIDRKIILKKSVDDIKSGKLEGRLLRDDYFQFSRDFYMLVQRGNVISCVLRRKDGSFIGLNIQETMLCEGIEDFLFNLVEEELTEDKEETIRFFYEILSR